MEPVFYRNGRQSPGLQRLQAIQIDILQDVLSFCEEHDITTFLVAGSALGAERHGAMIPWDDDIDLGMMREDYDRFIRLWPQKSRCPHILQCSASENGYPHDSAKILMPGTAVRISEFEGTGFRDGIFIDIFPFDRRLKSKALTAAQTWILGALNLILMSYSRNVVSLTRSRSYQLIRRLAFHLRKFLPLQLLTRIRAWISAARPFAKGEEIVCYEMYGFARHRKTIIDGDTILPPGRAKFGEQLVPVPKNNAAYLARLFGEYRKLPPETQRVPHHIGEADFAD